MASQSGSSLILYLIINISNKIHKKLKNKKCLIYIHLPKEMRIKG